MKKHKTSTGALPHSAGFPGTNAVKPRLHPAIQHINATEETLQDPEFISVMNDVVNAIMNLDLEIPYLTVNK